MHNEGIMKGKVGAGGRHYEREIWCMMNAKRRLIHDKGIMKRRVDEKCIILREDLCTKKAFWKAGWCKTQVLWKRPGEREGWYTIEDTVKGSRCMRRAHWKEVLMHEEGFMKGRADACGRQCEMEHSCTRITLWRKGWWKIKEMREWMYEGIMKESPRPREAERVDARWSFVYEGRVDAWFRHYERDGGHYEREGYAWWSFFQAVWKGRLIQEECIMKEKVDVRWRPEGGWGVGGGGGMERGRR